jgi:hypothetical protein
MRIFFQGVIGCVYEWPWARVDRTMALWCSSRCVGFWQGKTECVLLCISEWLAPVICVDNRCDGESAYPAGMAGGPCGGMGG